MISNLIYAIQAHMTCDLLARPCCIGLQGDCLMATRQQCQVLRGFFHDEAHLCSQVCYSLSFQQFEFFQCASNSSAARISVLGDTLGVGLVGGPWTPPPESLRIFENLQC